MSTRNALVVRGGWDGHDPVGTTEIFIPVLKDAGFEVTVEESLEVYADEGVMAGSDLIVQSWTMGDILVEEMHGLRVAVENGTGLAGWHGGLLDAFRGATDFQHLVGGQFVAHPDDVVDHEIAVHPDRADHPVVAGLPARTRLTTEQYWVQHDTACDVLMTTTHTSRPGTPWHEDVTVPVAWTRSWGRGRVFACSVGHTVADVQEPTIHEVISRGLLWAARSPR
ncbi:MULTISPECIES: ThuA domain-containing protein [unclassified Isoptericola]|uniref:ThuA domain-containing protein n=1 Tax=unclassified Isoptericola TaxID=2623355 RepID=UPI002712324F|nr:MULTISPECIES: ThuA domain-containing protein [unclassified Isoptericola]MDO8142952.1 ThuA domain-containing protein [Isoptericola sp. 178]MDO8146813.1 ThuA domain-containing protein [Isoptericola sp. b515]MDO8150873.1 ThuA domain-containing protein [Isoptericola sp. b408]